MSHVEFCGGLCSPHLTGLTLPQGAMHAHRLLLICSKYIRAKLEQHTVNYRFGTPYNERQRGKKRNMGT